MDTARFWRILRWNIAATVRWWQLGATVLLCLFIGWEGSRQVASAAQTAPASIQLSVWDGIFLGFAGPRLSDGSLLNFLRWFVFHLLFFYMIGDLAHGELVQRGHAVVPAIGSRQHWWWGKIALLALLTVGYVVLGVGAALIGARTLLPWSAAWQGGIFQLAGWDRPLGVPANGTTLVFWILALFIGTLFALAMWQTTLAVILRRSIYGLIASLGITICSWLLGTNQPGLVRWLPSSQSMLQRHSLWDVQTPGFSLSWSVVYNIIVAGAALGLGSWYVGQMDIFGKSLNDQH